MYFGGYSPPAIELCAEYCDVPSISAWHGRLVLRPQAATLSGRGSLPLRVAEWVFTVVFLGEYLLRLTAVRQPLRYAASFFGIIDLLTQRSNQDRPD